MKKGTSPNAPLLHNVDELCDTTKLLIVMVGLPGRGKTWLAFKLKNYLNWLGYVCKIFRVDNYRIAKIGEGITASFFDPGNEPAKKKIV
jgi:signal recognition particle GTPase